MKTSAGGRQLIEHYEGLILGAYDDYNDHVVHPGDPIRGVLTIGYGHTTDAGPPTVYVGQTITKEQADQILSKDLHYVEIDVNSAVTVPLNQNQFDALVSFQFNTGALRRSTALRDLNAGNYAKAADELLWYNHAQGSVNQGLINRRQAERQLFLDPFISKQTQIQKEETKPMNTYAFIAPIVTAVIGLAVGYVGGKWGFKTVINDIKTEIQTIKTDITNLKAQVNPVTPPATHAQ